MGGCVRPHDTPSKVVSVYLTTTTINTLAASIIWAVTTLYLMEAGLNIFQVMLVNTAFALTQVVFEVPTGVVADTIGRRASYLISISLVMVSTLLYLAVAKLGWGFAGFLVASSLLAFAWTFQSGAVEAWLVDALDHTGWQGPKDRVFASGSIAGEISMLAGTLVGGFLGQFNLAWPFIARAILLLASLIFVAVALHDSGFETRRLKWSTVLPEMRSIYRSGVRHGWRNPVVRPLMLENMLFGVFFMYGFYSLQPYLLDLIGKQLVWAAAAVTAAGALAGILGNWLVPRIMRKPDGGRRRPARVMLAMGALAACATLAAGLSGVLSKGRGSLAPVFILSAMWLTIYFTNGVVDPIRRTFINEHIPSRERATVLSLDALFEDVGATAGQPALGWISQSISIPAGWVVGSFFIFAGLPFLRRADRATDSTG